MALYARVVVREPRWSDLTYSVPDSLKSRLAPGQQVFVPWGKKEKRGIVAEITRKPPEGLDPKAIRPVSRTDGDEPLLDRDDLELAAWISRYYRCPLGPAVKLFIPPEGRDRQNWFVSLKLWDAPVADLSELGGDAEKLLEVLMDREARSPGKGLKIGAGRIGPLSHQSAEKALEELQRHGLIEVERGALRGNIRELTDTVYTLARNTQAASQTLKPVQKRILAALAEADAPLPAKELPGSSTSRALALKDLESASLILKTTAIRRRSGDVPSSETDLTHEPTGEQTAAIAALSEAVRTGGFHPFLLQGVTGSGKTEVYLKAIGEALETGKGALVIVPEIALTPQTAGRFTSRFPGQVAILHSGLGAGERFDEWWRLRRGEAKVAIGTRSALFAPVQDPGLIVVDEEHDTSFKQDSAPRYHARDSAVKMAQIRKIPVLLGSATPSLESIENVRQGRYRLLELTRRVASSRMPDVKVISLRKEDRREEYDPERPWFLSMAAEKAITATIQAGEQAMVFLNRRGYSPVFPCTSCGHTPECPDCAIPLTYHHQVSELRCHYCGYETDLPGKCSKCDGTEFDTKGLGTEQVEMALKEKFPKARTARLDRDSIRKKGALAKILDRFRDREIDLLVGTQILAKGHDFPGVTLVVVVNADQTLRVPDFRSEERAAQLLAQVSGRAGRKDLPGRVLVQTYEPEHPVIQWLKTPNRELWDRLLEERRDLGYPPYGRIATVELSDRSEATAQSAAELLADAWKLPSGVKLFGPTVPPLGKLGGRFRRRLLLKGTDTRSISTALDQFYKVLHAALKPGAFRDLQIDLDVDPQTLL